MRTATASGKALVDWCGLCFRDPGGRQQEAFQEGSDAKSLHLCSTACMTAVRTVAHGSAQHKTTFRLASICDPLILPVIPPIPLEMTDNTAKTPPISSTPVLTEGLRPPMASPAVTPGDSPPKPVPSVSECQLGAATHVFDLHADVSTQVLQGGFDMALTRGRLPPIAQIYLALLATVTDTGPTTSESTFKCLTPVPVNTERMVRGLEILREKRQAGEGCV